MTHPTSGLGANVARVAIARFVSRAGGVAAFFIGVWGKASYEFDATPGQLAILMGTMGVCAIVGSTIAGGLIDRYDPRRVLLVGELVFVPAALAPVFATSLTELTIAVGVMDIVGMTVFTSVAAFPPYLTEDDRELQRINAVVEGAMNLAFVAGPAIGALLVRFATVDHVFVFDALTSVVAVAVVLPVTVRRMARAPEHRSFWVKSRAGFVEVYRSPYLRLSVLVGTLMWLSFGAFGALEPLFFRDVLGRGPEMIGWVNAIFGAGLMAGAWLLARIPQRIVTLRFVVFAAMAGGLSEVLYVGTRSLTVVVLGAIVLGVFLGALFPAVRTLIQWHTTEGMYGRVTGAVQVHNQSAELLPLTFVPFLAAVFGVQAVLVGTGVVCFFIATTLIREAARLDRGRPGAPEVVHDGVAAAEPLSL